MIEYITLGISIIAILVAIIVAVDYTNDGGEAVIRFEEPRTRSGMTARERLILEELRKDVESLKDNGETNVGNPYTLRISHIGKNNVRRFDGVVKHVFVGGRRKERPLSWATPGSFENIPGERNTSELQAYRKGDKEGQPSILVNMGEYESFEVIKKGDG